jgi:death-on-curing protein
MYINTLAIIKYGGKTGPVRQHGLVEQVVGAAFQTFEGYDPHPEPFDKAAVLMRGITQGHPFTDGNKRTGFMAAMYYLEHVNLPMPSRLPIDEILDLCLRVSSGEIRDVQEIARELQRLWNCE